MKVYIVEGSSGEYSDHSEWTVAGYHKEVDAQNHVKAAQEYAGQYRTFDWDNLDWEDMMKWEKGNPYDPDMDYDSSGVNYTYYPVEIKDYFEIKEAE